MQISLGGAGKRLGGVQNFFGGVRTPPENPSMVFPLNKISNVGCQCTVRNEKWVNGKHLLF